MSQAQPATGLKITSPGESSRQTRRKAPQQLQDDEDSDEITDSEYHDAYDHLQEAAFDLSGSGKPLGNISYKRELEENINSSWRSQARSSLIYQDDNIAGPSTLRQTKMKPNSVSNSPVNTSSGSSDLGSRRNITGLHRITAVPTMARMKQLLEALDLDPKDEVSYKTSLHSNGKKKRKEKEVGITRKEVIAAMQYMHFSKVSKSSSIIYAHETEIVWPLSRKSE